MVTQAALQHELAHWSEVFGEVLAEQVPAEVVATQRRLLELATARRDGDPDAEGELVDGVAGLSLREARWLARMYSISFELDNLAEDRHRLRVVRERERDAYPAPRAESLAAALARLQSEGLEAAELQRLLAGLTIEPVFTAHPTEAKRRTGREQLRRLRQGMATLNSEDLLPRERQRVDEHLRAALTALWQTDLLRWRRPTVLEEVDTGLYCARTVWDVVPQFYRDLETALADCWPGHRFDLPPLLRFGSWIGGDRDGNPNVTADITAEALRRHRAAAIEAHLERCRALYVALSPSERQVACSDELRKALAQALRRFRGARQAVTELAPHETCRRWLSVIEWRLQRTLDSDLLGDLLVGAYRRSSELKADLALLRDSLKANHGERLAADELSDWLWQTRVFGFHLCRLDIRQDAAWLRNALTDVLVALGHERLLELDEAGRVALLTRSLGYADAVPPERLGPEAREALALFTVLADVAELAGGELLGGFVISRTEQLSDILCLLWLATWAHLAGRDAIYELPIVPLLESIDVLARSPQILEAMWDHPAYAAHLHRQGNLQMAMIGYSDSTRDGGYLTANWSLYRAQQSLHDVATARGIRILFFHGRGGSLGRGGGPAAESILSLPRTTVGAGLRLTEQGEILAERYGNPAVAYRHLEQLAWATLLVVGQPAEPPPSAWTNELELLSDDALATYRALVDDPDFADYFRQATPIDAIEALPMGSRPSRRRERRALAELRAIPWVFAWTQCRLLLPAWFGAGTACLAAGERHGWEPLREMYRDWSFFRVLIDNAELALAKSDLGIARLYAALAEPPEVGERLWETIRLEWARTRAAILEITGEADLLARIPWLHEAVRVRSPAVDVLNLIQIEWLRRARAALPEVDEERELLEEVIRLTIGGIASGLRNTG